MAQFYKSIWLPLFLSIIWFSDIFCLGNMLQATKVVNDSSQPISCLQSVPARSVAYTYIVSSDLPQAYIAKWEQLSHGTAPIAREWDQSNPLNVSIQIAFTPEASQTYVDNFFETLGRLYPKFKGRPGRHGVHKNHFVIQISPHFSQNEFEVALQESNIEMYRKWLQQITTMLNKQLAQPAK